MSLQYKNKDLLKIRLVYSEEIKSVRKRTKEIVILKFLLKNLNNYLIKTIRFTSISTRKKKRPKRLTKYQILSIILPFFDTAAISRKQYAFRNYAGTYEVEVMDSKSLDDSLFLAKKSINDFINNKRTINNNNQ